MAPIVAPIAQIPAFTAPRDGRLTAAMLRQYRADGVLVLADFVTREQCRTLRERALELVDTFDPSTVQSVFSTTEEKHQRDAYFSESASGIHFFLEAEALDADGKLTRPKHECLNKMGHAMHDLDPIFDAFSRTPALAEVVRCLGYDDAAILQSMYIFKPPAIGGEVVAHQDSTFLYTEPETCTGFWFALEDATLDNGCMQFVPGAHTGPLRRRHYRNEAGVLTTEVLNDTPWSAEPVAVEVNAGTLVIFHGRAPHQSAANRSSQSRHAYTFHVIDRSAHYPSNNWLQRKAELPLRGFAGS